MTSLTLSLRQTVSMLGLIFFLLLAPLVSSASDLAAVREQLSAESQAAAVSIDGKLLFMLRGTSSLPARERADQVEGHIKEFASNEQLDPNKLTTVSENHITWITDGEHRITAVVAEDAAYEKLELTTFTELALHKVIESIINYRKERTLPEVTANIVKAIGMTIAIGLLFWLAGLARQKLHAWTESKVRTQINKVEEKTGQILSATNIWDALKSLGGLLFTLSMLLVTYLYINALLSLFPLTRGIAQLLFQYLVRPINTIGQAFVSYLPDLFFLIIIFLIFRYALKILSALFASVAVGRIRWHNFDQDWAWPTYRLVRLLVFAFALVVAYPYLPGSDSAAFKGVSIFLGVLASIGSSSIISNMIAGYSMTYRRAFRVGDRIKIGGTTGDVTEMRLLVTHLRTPKNEEVIIPNSVVLGSEVINYSSLAKERGLILHTTVGIGYEVPWRQVEAMLLMAARRTPGIMTNRDPFVLRRELGDFAITYELNVYVDNTDGVVKMYSALHANILDVFNEYGVAIMTPAYEGDPEQPKYVPKDQWYAAPAKAPGES